MNRPRTLRVSSRHQLERGHVLPAPALAPRVRWLDHLGALLGIASTFLVSERILAVSHFDTTTAYAVLTTGGYGDVLVGAAISILPLLLGSVAATWIWLVVRRWPKITPERRPRQVAVGVVLMGLVVVIAPVAYFAAFSVGMVIASLLVDRVFRRRPSRSSASARHMSAVISLTCGAVLIGVTFSIIDTPWLPAQEVVPRSRGLAFTAYVLSRSDTDVTLLTNHRRQVETYPISSVTVSPCSEAGVSHPSSIFVRVINLRSAAGLLFFPHSAANYPHCPRI